jgi:hypothetical protein
VIPEGRDNDATQGTSMRPGQNKERMRGRPNNRKGPNPLTRTYESSGPDVKIRGTALHIGEKYLQLARDAQSSGDPVTAESYLQHAEHYFRLIASAQQAQQQSALGYMRQPGDVALDDDDEDGGISDRFASPQERFVGTSQPSFAPPVALASAPQPSVERGFFPAPDRSAYDRQDRAPRQERPFQERPFQERPFQERPFQEKPYQDKPYPERPYGERHFHGRDPESRSPRGGRAPREFAGEPGSRGEPRPEPRMPSDDPERKGLPAFVTAPARPQPEIQDDSPPVIHSLATVLDTQPEAEREVSGFHLRPRRRRRTKPDLVLDQETRVEDTDARDPVGD